MADIRRRAGFDFTTKEIFTASILSFRPFFQKGGRPFGAFVALSAATRIHFSGEKPRR
jgi:hypothetical protein